MNQPRRSMPRCRSRSCCCLRELQREFGMAAIFVTHDIGVAVEVADKIAVMYAGEFVETGTVRDVIRDARHPYARGLLAANLHGVRKGERLDAIPGAPPALHEPPRACSFAPRCRHVEPRCIEGAAAVRHAWPGTRGALHSRRASTCVAAATR